MSRRGEISSGQLALLILAVAGFALAALFLFGIFKNEDLADRDICRLSILSRSTAPAVAQQAVPLSCFTEKICITLDGAKDDSCKQFAGEKNIRLVKVKINKDLADQEKTLEIIEREYSNAMFDCWYMTGQGKLDVFKGTTNGVSQTTMAGFLSLLGSDIDQVIKTVQPQCIVCSRIALSETLLEQDNEFNVLSRVDVNGYMSTKNIPGSSLTYLQAFTDESVRSYGGIDKINLSEEGNKYANHSFGGPQLAILFMQIKTEGDPDKIAEEAAILSGTAIGGGGLLTGIGRQAIRTFPVVSTITAIAATGGAYLAAKDIAEDNQAISFAACREYEKTEANAKLGCSLVKPIVWSADEVNRICFGGIEGNL